MDGLNTIKSKGTMVAISRSDFATWEYWLLDGGLYSISDEDVVCVWCSIKRLAEHLHRLWQITGHKYFTEGADMTILDEDFFSNYYYA